MDDISFNIACTELKIAQIAQLNQPFQLLHLVHIYGHGFYELSRMLMRKNVNNDVSKDSPITHTTGMCCLLLGYSLEPRQKSRALCKAGYGHIRMLALGKPV